MLHEHEGKLWCEGARQGAKQSRQLIESLIKLLDGHVDGGQVGQSKKKLGS